MEQGMLWFDNSQKDLVLVHPSMLSTDIESPVPFYGKEITVRPYRPVLPGHIWIGVDETPKYAQPVVEANASQGRERAEVQEIKGAAVQSEKVPV